MEVRVHVLKSHGREIQDPLGVTDRLATTNNILYDNTKTCILYFIWQFRECCLSLKHSKNNLPSSSIPLGYFNSSVDLRAFVHFLWCDSGSVKECWSQIVAGPQPLITNLLIELGPVPHALEGAIYHQYWYTERHTVCGPLLVLSAWLLQMAGFIKTLSIFAHV